METRISAEKISEILNEEQMKNTKAGCYEGCKPGENSCALLFCSDGDTVCVSSCPGINPYPYICPNTNGEWVLCWDNLGHSCLK